MQLKVVQTHRALPNPALNNSLENHKLQLLLAMFWFFMRHYRLLNVVAIQLANEQFILHSIRLVFPPFFSFCLFFLFVCFSPLKELMIIKGKLSGGQVFHPKFLMVLGLPRVGIWFHLINLISIFHISSGYHNDYNSKNNCSCMLCVASFKSLSMFHIFLLIFLCSRQGADLLFL